jgi:hypothetical protein
MMRVLRKVTVTLATAALSVGLIGMSAPAADADSSWGGRGGPPPPVATP